MQSTSEIRSLLQQNIFGNAAVNGFNSYSKAILNKLARCHTIGIGKHHYQCNNTSCNNMHYQYHSCGNRHCPNCGNTKKEQWIMDRHSELLPTSYFHIVFTLPQELRSLCMGNRKLLFNLLFKSAHHTLLTLGAKEQWLGAQPGIVSILHTNGQDLVFHPHVHCIVTGGGLHSDGKWIPQKRKNGKFIFPRALLEKEYKNYFLKQLQQLYEKNKLCIADETAFHEALIAVHAKQWNVYAKAPFGGPAQVIEYLGRYTHNLSRTSVGKVAITAHRITQITATHISFKYKDYADGHKQKIMTLTLVAFLRRFEQHILPRCFVKIRHAGFLTNRNKMQRIKNILAQLQLPAPRPKVKFDAPTIVLITTGKDITICPKCQTGKLIRIATYLNINGQLINSEKINNSGSPKKTNQPKPICK